MGSADQACWDPDKRTAAFILRLEEEAAEALVEGNKHELTRNEAMAGE